MLSSRAISIGFLYLLFSPRLGVRGQPASQDADDRKPIPVGTVPINVFSGSPTPADLRIIGGIDIRKNDGGGTSARSVNDINFGGILNSAENSGIAGNRISTSSSPDGDTLLGSIFGTSNANGGNKSQGSKSKGGKSGSDKGTSSSSGSSTKNLQSSLTLDSSVIAPGFAHANGNATAGQADSLTSKNNFINFCVGKKITNGQQITSGSCNPAPMGDIPAKNLMPSSKFQFPKNFGNIPANKAFTISMAINNLATGNFTNAASAYFAAPQQLNDKGLIQGHSHVVVERIDSLTQAKPNDPTKFAFFKGLNAAAVKGVLTADVTNGLPAGVYRLASINTASNHQPALVPIAQHGSLDDIIYFTVTDGTSNSNGSKTNPNKSNGKQGKGKANNRRLSTRFRSFKY